jgi:hypothetical protein
MDVLVEITHTFCLRFIGHALQGMDIVSRIIIEYTNFKGFCFLETK